MAMATMATTRPLAPPPPSRTCGSTNGCACSRSRWRRRASRHYCSRGASGRAASGTVSSCGRATSGQVSRSWRPRCRRACTPRSPAYPGGRPTSAATAAASPSPTTTHTCRSSSCAGTSLASSRRSSAPTAAATDRPSRSPLPPVCHTRGRTLTLTLTKGSNSRRADMVPGRSCSATHTSGPCLALGRCARPGQLRRK